MNFIKSSMKHIMRRGRRFKKCLLEIAELEKLSANDLKLYEEEKLKTIVKIAYENVPYYHETFKRLKLHYTDIKTVKDLPKLPLINKKIVQSHFADFRNRNFRGRAIKGITSGTTGTPGIFLRDLRSIIYEEAFIVRQWQWAGETLSAKRAVLRGEIVFKSGKTSPPFWKINWLERKLLLSSFHLTDKTIPLFITQIRKYRPRILQAYPSTAYAIAQFLKNSGEYLDIPVIQTGSELLYPPWRELIEERLRSKIFDYYGQAERVAFCAECEHHNGMHVILPYSCFELVDEKGNGAYSKGRIVGTTLNNMLMPLIRYQTDDLAELIHEPCRCNRQYPRIKPIEGRESNIIYSSDGKIISHTLFVIFFRKLKGIKLSQIIQKKDFSFVVKIVKDTEYSDLESQNIISSVKTIIGKDTSVTIEFVNDIPREKSGKYRWIFSERGL